MFKFPPTTAPLAAQCLTTVNQFFADRYRAEVLCPRCGIAASANRGPSNDSIMVVCYPAGWDTAEVNDYDGWKDTLDVDETTTEIENMATGNMFKGEHVPTAYIEHRVRVSPEHPHTVCHRWAEESESPLNAFDRYERCVMKVLMQMGVVDPRPFLEKPFADMIEHHRIKENRGVDCALNLLDMMWKEQ